VRLGIKSHDEKSRQGAGATNQTRMGRIPPRMFAGRSMLRPYEESPAILFGGPVGRPGGIVTGCGTSRRAGTANSGGKPPHSTWAVPILELWLIGNVSPSMFAGHGMPCPYETGDRS
jgi:hypothetical protein